MIGWLAIEFSRSGGGRGVRGDLLERTMFDYEGSRSEFLKLLAECGEEPAFIARARAPQIALDSLLQTCEAKRNEMLEWPKFHLSVLAQHVGGNWSRLGCLLAVPESVALLETLHTNMPTSKTAQTNWLLSDRAALGQFLESAERFNRNWRTYLDGLDLESVNKPRREYNEFYVLEKACAFGNEIATEGFESLQMIQRDDLIQRFPLLTLPSRA